MKILKYAWLFLWWLPSLAFGQSDSSLVLTFDQYMELVKLHHPVAIQAALQIEKGNASLLQARGAFDPKVFTQVGEKDFEGKQYFRHIDGGLKIPTWLGLELKGGFEQNRGVYLNPEKNTPQGGLWYGGISIPVGQGLFIDQRRAELRQAQIYRESTQAERQLLVNDLLYETGKIYWDWFMAYHVRQAYQEALVLADQRFRAVKQGAVLGDRPFIDTLEASIQIQNIRLNLQQAQLDFTNTTALLSVYLWAEGVVPLELTDGTKPLPLNMVTALDIDPGLLTQLDNLVSNHPELRQYRFKLEQLEVERRLKSDQLKPDLNLSYNALSRPVNGDPLATYSINNYKFGLEFSMPLLLRKERGALRLAELKIQEAQLGFTSKNASLTYKAIASFNEWETTKNLIDLYTQTVQDYNSLVQGERRLFNAGESSLFLVNAREMGLINTQVKLIELLAKNRKASLTTNYALGLLSNP